MSDDENKNNVVSLFGRKPAPVVNETPPITEEPEWVKDAKDYIEKMSADGINNFLIIGINKSEAEQDAEYAFAMTDDWYTADLSLAADYIKLQIMQRLAGATVEHGEE